MKKFLGLFMKEYFVLKTFLLDKQNVIHFKNNIQPKFKLPQFKIQSDFQHPQM